MPFVAVMVLLGILILFVLRRVVLDRSGMYRHAKHVLAYYEEKFDENKIRIPFETRAQCDMYDWEKKIGRDQLEYLCLKAIDTQRRVWAAGREQVLILDELSRYGPFMRYETMRVMDRLSAIAQPDVVLSLSYMDAKGNKINYKDIPVPVLAIYLLWESRGDGRSWQEVSCDMKDDG